MRWRYVSALLGKSKLMTTFTAWMSIPRVNRSTSRENVRAVNLLLSVTVPVGRLQDIQLGRPFFYIYIYLVGLQNWFATPTCADQVSAQSISEVMEHTVPVFLHHLCVNVEAWIAKLGDFPSQKLNPLGGVTEDDGLIDLKLEKKNHSTFCYSKTNWQIMSIVYIYELFWIIWGSIHPTVKLVTLTLEKSVLRQCTFCLSVT